MLTSLLCLALLQTTPSTTPATAPTSLPATLPTTLPTSQPSLPREAELLLKATLAHTKYLGFLVARELPAAQAELAAAKVGPVQPRAGKPDAERVIRPNGKAVYLFTTGKARLDKVAELQSKVDDFLRQQKELAAGKLFTPPFDFASPAIGNAGTTTAPRGKVIRVLGPDQAILGYGAFRYWVYGLNTKDFIEGGPESFPDLVALTGSTNYLDLTEGQMKTVFVMRAVKGFDLQAEAAKRPQ